MLRETLPGSVPGPYQIQAAIAAVHDEAPSADATDWPQILALYDMLLDFGDNPIVALNHSVAYSMVHGPKAGLERVQALSNRIPENHRLEAVRAHLFERLGDLKSAADSFQKAADQATNYAEQRYLLLARARTLE